jgi:secondary thiamine-phosphate synthase enzyme
VLATEFVDVTDHLIEAVNRLGVRSGVLTVHSRHTTAGIMINEHEPLLLQDLRAMFERLIPEDAAYAHDDFRRRAGNISPRERRNGHAHCRAALVRTSETIPIIAGVLALGRWQRVFFVDFDGGQRREIHLAILHCG